MFVWLLNLPLRLLLLILLLTKESFLKVISGWRVKFIFFLAYFSGLSFLVCHWQREVRLWRAVCYKIFCFWNLRYFWEKLLIFGILKCSVTIEMCHSNYCNFGRLKYVIFGKLPHFSSPQIEMCHFCEIEMCHFREIEMCNFREIEMYHFREIEMCHFWAIVNISYSGDGNVNLEIALLEQLFITFLEFYSKNYSILF